MCEVTEQILDGSGLIATEPGLLTPLPWPGWKARIRSLQVDGARADYVEYDPYRFEVPALSERADRPLRMMLVVILAGTSTGTVGGHPLTLTPKQAALIDGRAPLSFVAPEPIRAVRLFVDQAHLPAESLEGMTQPYALLKQSPLVAACVGFITGLLQIANPVVEPHDAVAVSQPLIALQASLLNEALHQGRAHDVLVPRSRREVIESYIDEHLDDPRLAAGTIADALGVTVRTVHAAYDGSEDTVGAVIRDRRVTKARTLLAVRSESPNVGVLAGRVGLTRDQLTRAFQRHTGQTVPDWWREHRARQT